MPDPIPWLSAWTALCDRQMQVGYAALSSDEKSWISIRALIDSVQNGGAISYFFNSGADMLPDCLRALDELGAVSVRRNLERVMALFPAGVPDTMDERNAVIDSWPDDGRVSARLKDIDAALMPLVAELDRTLDAFLQRSGLFG
jgi:hypothetical protein